MDKSAPDSRPDLFAQPTVPSSKSMRILATLEHGPQPDAPARKLWQVRPAHLAGMLATVALLACGVAWVSYVNMSPPLRTGAGAGEWKAPPAPPADVERLAAAIVNEPLPSLKGAQKDGPHPRATATARAAPALDGHAALATAATAAALPALAPAHPPLRAAPGVTALDSDVALLAALMANGGQQAPAIGYRREVVDRSGGDSTEVLLRRCQQLGGMEAGLCRARICSGLWLHEAACRVSASD